MDYIIDGAILTDIADVFRAQSGSMDLIPPEKMAEEAVASYERGLAARSYETWTITLADGTAVEKDVALL